MTVATTITAYQTLHATITGVKSAPTKMPQALNTADLPLAFAWPGPTIEQTGWQPYAGWYSVRRYYIVRCYVKPIAQGSGFDDGYQEAIALLQRFGDAYMDNANLSGAVAHIGPQISDSGVRGDFQWVAGSDTNYHGFEFRIETVEKVAT
jgi:hypothetical protein